MTYTNVILVDSNDNVIGHEEKLKAHEQGLLHRAFSIFIYRKTNKGYELLLQKRASEKYHCSALWTNTCCSHPQNEDDSLPCAVTRLNFEMGVTDIPLVYINKFTYKALCKGGLTEHEIDYVYVGEFNNKAFTPNANEVSTSRWVPINKLEEGLLSNPHTFTPWLNDVLKLVKIYLKNKGT